MSKTASVDIQAPGQCATGMYKVLIMDSKTGQPKYESEWKHNLILNQGLSHVSKYVWMECMSYCYAGDGTTANYSDSSTDTANCTVAGTVNSIGSTIDFTTFVNGDCILWDDGSQGYITSRPNANQAIVTGFPPAGVPYQEFSVLKTSRTIFSGNCLKKVSSYLTGGSAQIADVVHNATTSVYRNRRTYDFAVEAVPVTYNEIGLSPESKTPPITPAHANQPKLFSRIVLSPGLSLDAGDYLRVVYQLSITLGPTNEVAGAVAFDNDGSPESWTGYGRLYNNGLSMVATSSASVGGYTTFDSYANEPSIVAGASYTMWVSYVQGGSGGGHHAGSFPEDGSVRGSNFVAPSLTNTTTENLYESGLTYSLNKMAQWAIGQANTSPIRSMGFGHTVNIIGTLIYPTVELGFCFIFDDAVGHWKLNTQVLTLRIKYSWSRTLTID